ncbi:hypothetical protein HUG20_18010 [Salicibibacter cibi]|uniref:Uncharacterized protein n=1 Tax=Salicibibacter cibi TaxID=2743001 RepID=A0A7T6ZDY7_9BACI|nr:hypothetical protein HUG20_18010 [Salicibibacter cibi]
MTSFFNDEQFLVSVGFTEDDVNVNTPRLYSDTFTPATVQRS